LTICEKALPPDHPYIGITLQNLANLYRAQGRYAEAEPLFQRALAINKQALPPDHPSNAATLENYANLLREMSDRQGRKRSNSVPKRCEPGCPPGETLEHQ
jgi:tetratricopeptide (TPR) repeat protein